MKFKSIEISGFRAYDRPENATFQFMDSEGEPLNFISIYAPNGFGKTSFYDAVEWGVTNNVSRLWQRKNSSEKALNRLRSVRESKKKIDLLRNTNASGPTYVRYLTTSMENPTERKLKVHGSSKADTTRSHGVRLSFRRVILSQEWISAFLKEDDGELRYKKFMENPDLQDTDKYYQNVKALEETNRKKMEDLKEEIDKLKSKIQSLDEGNILDGVNELVKKIDTDHQGPKLRKIALTATQKEVKDLQDLVANELIEVDDRSELKVLLGYLDQAIVGGNGVPSIKQYFQSLKDLQKTQQENSLVKGNIENFEKIQSANNELKNSEKERDNLRSSNEALKKLMLLFNKFDKVRSGLSEKKNIKGELEKQVENLEKDIERTKREQLSAKTALDSLVKREAELQKDMESLPKLEKDFKQVNLDITQKEKAKKKLEDSISKNETKRDGIAEEIKELEQIRQEALDGQFALTTVAEDKELSKVIKELMDNADNRFKLKKRLEGIQKAIQEQEELNVTLEAFIASGLEIINKSQMDTCPLCEQGYGSYEALLDKVSNNTALSASIKIILEQRSELNNEIKELDSASEILLEKLIAHYDAQLEKLKEQRSEITDQLKEYDKDLAKTQREMTDVQQTRSSLLERTNGKSPSDYRKDLTNRIDKNSKELTKAREALTIKENDLTGKEKSLNEAKGRVKLLEEELEVLSTNEDYTKVGQWFIQEVPDRSLTKATMEQKAKENQDSLKKVMESHRALQERIKTLEETLKSLDRSQLEERLKKLLQQSEDLEKQIGGFEHHVENRLSLDIKKADQSKLLNELKAKRRETKKKQEQTEKLLEDLKRLEKLATNLIPFLQSENARMTKEEYEKELTFLKKTVTPLLKSEVKRTKEFLEREIKEFFYVELINEIYRKIDPHPDFKSVEFKADFDLENPSLDVFVRNSDDESILIPNLYFSTAQINILSLSIFLASALNSKEYDCIFIDDPIQSMDSINILSTIDLLRSIVVKHDKQIILSTHDHNFHNLLKRKMPSKLFKSKFMELESFGKVRADVAVNRSTSL
ncbi:AAA family ATPase [Flagellimonas sp.]|uniref:AAA family ATPase n=1 Tax=Flagellimonas sp. TaxID=2058762 RepID=UPI003BAF1011